MLYNQYPWSGKNIPELIQNIKTKAPYFPDTDKVSEEIKNIIKKMLAFEEENRYSSMELKNHSYFN